MHDAAVFGGLLHRRNRYYGMHTRHAATNCTSVLKPQEYFPVVIDRVRRHAGTGLSPDRPLQGSTGHCTQTALLTSRYEGGQGESLILGPGPKTLLEVVTWQVWLDHDRKVKPFRLREVNMGFPVHPLRGWVGRSAKMNK